MENLLKRVTSLNEEIAKLEKERLVAKSKKEMIEKSLLEKLKKYQEDYGVNLSGKSIADIEDALTNELNKVASKCENEFALKERVVNAIKSGDVSTARKILGIDEDVKVPKEESRVNVTPVEEEQEEVEDLEDDLEEDIEEEPEMEFDEPEDEPEVEFEEPEDESEMEFDEPEVVNTPAKKTPTKKAPIKKTPVVEVEEEEDFTDISDDIEEAKVPDDEDDNTNMSNFGSFSFDDDEDDEDDSEFIIGNSPKSVARGNAEYKQKLTSVEKSVEEVEKGTAEDKKAEKTAPKKPTTSFLFDDDDDGESLGFKSLLSGSKFQV